LQSQSVNALFFGSCWHGIRTSKSRHLMLSLKNLPPLIHNFCICYCIPGKRKKNPLWTLADCVRLATAPGSKPLRLSRVRLPLWTNVPGSRELLIHHHHMSSKTGTTCTHNKSGIVAYQRWYPHWRCKYRHHFFMCHKYHVKHTSKQYNPGSRLFEEWIKKGYQ